VTPEDLAARFIVVAVSVVGLLGCTGPSGSIALRTQSVTACPEARTEGVLELNPDSGVGLRDFRGFHVAVIWPAGYSARDDGGRTTVFDEQGRPLAHVGDHVAIGGQDVGGPWLGCGGVTVIP